MRGSCSASRVSAVQAPHLRHAAGLHRDPGHLEAAVGDPDRGHPVTGRDRSGVTARVRPDRDAVTDAEGSGHDPGPRHLLAARAPLDLEDRARERRRGVGGGPGEQGGEHPHEVVDPRPGDRGTEQHGQDPRGGHLLAEGPPEPWPADVPVLEVCRDETLVDPRQGLDQPGPDGPVVEVVGHRGRSGRAQSGDPAQHGEVGSETDSDLLEQVGLPGPGAVDLVDEQHRRHPEALQGAQQHACLGLHALHRRHDEHDGVEHAEDPFHLGDEVGVPGCVDEGDGDLVHDEGDDGRPDGDAPPPLEVEGVRAGTACVDAADLVEHPDGVQQPLGQAGLAGIDVGEDAQVESLHGASCP